jgi:ATP-dependent DNA helicase RecQ
VAEPVAPQHLALDDAALQRRKQHELDKMRRLIGYANARQCRRQKILGYFGEQWDADHCTACDNCLQDGAFGATRQHPLRPLSDDEWLVIQKILSCIARMQGRYGRSRVVQVLMGSQAREIRDTFLVRLSTYGLLKGMARTSIEIYIDALIEAECVRIVGDEFPKLDLTALGQAVMRRQQQIHLSLPPLHPTSSPPAAMPVPSLSPQVVVPGPGLSPSSLATRNGSTPTRPAADAPYDAVLMERLRLQRTTLARSEAVPPYCVVHDSTLREMAVHLPTDRQALRRIRGIGEAKDRKYGDIFLEVIRDYLDQK